ncbi:T9SS type A sorting domain-containing protein [Algibacter pacificus]|uniref:T9SS type A sorting domain-containing protein n=1 Tax=Algibacter pacificus TaxID=2599389 RepID=UPI00164FA2F4|nr:zinc-dependent metalloprotease family protein [Algibacter pacificus]
MKRLYFKTTYFLFLVFLFSIFGYSQNGKALWTKTSQSRAAKLKISENITVPEKAINYTLNVEGLKDYLKDAPKRDSESAVEVVLSFPTANGDFEQFEIEEASVLHPDLQAEMPNSRSYIGKSIEHPGHTIRFSVTPQGLHTMLMSSEASTQFIDPINYGESDYVVYNKSDLPAQDAPFSCGFKNIEVSKKTEDNKEVAAVLNDGFLRTYRLAIASTIEYSEFHWKAAGLTASSSVDDKKNAVMNAMIVTMTRVNALYERELSISMQFVADNKDVIFIDTDTFSNDDADALIYQSQMEIDAIIGEGNYDVGHTFSTGAGGLAELGSVCVSGKKAQGVTGSDSPVGDAYDIDYVAHELGHQFGALHTFNSVEDNCGGGNRTTESAYEPGSGTTIMAYAGICSPDNVQANSDDYFHQNSLQLIWNHISDSRTSCAIERPSGNAEPVALVEEKTYVIPISTPYKLLGSSTDADGTDSHTYTWEQYDLGSSGLPLETNSTGPLVRSYQGTSNPIRYVPALEDLIYSNGSTDWEKLASVSRDINFKLTVRDNAEYGRTSSAGITFATTDVAGPFVVTSQNEPGLSWAGGSLQTITWDVAGTNANGINTDKVNILLSTDGGLTYPTTLASNVDNNGSLNITAPILQAANCRIMVEAVGNIFFAINKEDFAIGYTVTKTCDEYSTSPNIDIPDNTNIYEVSSIEVGESAIVTDINVGVNITHTYKGDMQLVLVGPNNEEVNLISSFFCKTGNLFVTFDDSATAFDCNNTETNETYQPENKLSVFNGENAKGTWRLKYVDLGAGDTGTLNSWFIEICETSLEPLEVVTVGLEDLKVFPNPNTGEFNLNFSPVSDNVHVEVFDVRGRRVYTENFINEELINETINLHQVQSGMYVLKVSDGSLQIAKKIIVK